MTLPQLQAGAMISLQCNRRQAHDLLGQITEGYATLANLNASSQMIVSGDQAAIDQMHRLAGSNGIRTRLLPVSNAFHSRLMVPAAETLAKKMTLPPRLANPKMHLFRGTDGKEVFSGHNLPDHFIHQITARVNFIALVESMAATSDIIIEVGPGQVLSGLVNAITNGDGPTCLPLESKSFQTGDLNRLLARLFVHGTAVNWDKLYANRLVHPFVPAGDKSFYINPCEKPLAEDIDYRPNTPISTQSPVDSSLSHMTGISQATINAYLKKRGPFLAEVIKADLKHSLPEDEHSDRPNPTKTAGGAEIRFAPKSAPASPPGSERFYTRIAELTGFPRKTLTPELRLLDDLNLDSIKSGDLIAGYAQDFGLAGQVDPAAMVNASIQEIIALFEGLDSGRKTGNRADGGLNKQDALQTLVQQVTRINKLSEAKISLDATVGANLGLAADHLEKLLQKISEHYHLDLNIDIPPLIDRSLNQIADIIVRIANAGKTTAPAAINNLPRPWVREFRVDLIERQQPALPPGFGKRTEDQWSRAKVLILGDDAMDPVCVALGDQLTEIGAEVSRNSFDAAVSGDFSDHAVGYSHFIAVLPRTRQELKQSEGRLKSVIKRLASAAIPPPASRGRRRRNCLAFVQFGGGFFGTRFDATRLSQCCTTALAKSVHLERTDLKSRVIDFDPALAAEMIAAKTISELRGPANFAEVGYDIALTRRTNEVSPLPGNYESDAGKWSHADVILVTGGAKGITSECALALARTTGARMALIGSTALRAPDEPGPQEQKIFELLQRYERNGLEAHYFSCDVRDRDSIKKTIEQIRQDLGQITGVIHGAGLNMPRRISQATIEDAYTEVSPKVIGAMNILAELRKDPPRLIVGLTSVIGITGMPGNSWYGFSNEALDFILRRFRKDHPQTKTLSVAYSIWRDEGMGAKLGSVAALKKMGIDAVPTEEGAKRFVRLFLHNPGTHQVIVAARMPRLDTMAMQAAAPISGARYAQNLLQHIPGVESAFLVHLSHSEDLYLQDHCFNGSYLFPTVFGLEAMAQAVAHVTGTTEFSSLRIENLRLQRPITVDPEREADIIVYAQIQERPSEDDYPRAEAGIVKLGTDSATDFFSARFVLGLPDAPAAPISDSRRRKLNIRSPDLYRKRLLFQGPRFHRIDGVYQLERQEGDSGIVLAKTSPGDPDPGKLAFARSGQRRLLLGDPFRRDALLQSAALLIPQDTSLPVFIKRWDIYQSGQAASQARGGYVQTRLIAHLENQVNTDVKFIYDKGGLIESLDGYRLKILQHHDDYPTVADLLDPADHDTAQLQKHLSRLAHEANLIVPDVGVAFLPGIHDWPQSTRRERVRPLIGRVVQRATGCGQPAEAQVEVSWQPSGKPVASIADENIEVSLAHDQRYCIAVASDRAVGCDIAPVTHRTLQQWIGLLGPECRPLIDEKMEADALDLHCTCLWAAREALQKLGIPNVKSISVKQLTEYGSVLQCDTDQGVRKIAALPILLTRGNRRVIALNVVDSSTQMPADTIAEVDYPGFGVLLGGRLYKVVEGGPQGQITFIHRFPVTFHPAGQMSRHVYFSHYFSWAGMVRETAIWPVLERMAKQVATGKWGGVTNFADLKIMGEATTQDMIEAWLWVSDKGGQHNSVVDLTYDFRKVLPGGGYERLAWLEQRTTWVRILEKGIAKVEPLPDYLESYMKDMLPRYRTAHSREEIPQPFDRLHEHSHENYLYIATAGTTVEPVLHTQLFETSLEDANIVGNIYFAKYYAWQGRVRDRYFYSLVPECFEGTGEAGELICLHCRVDHLREAMPFDRVEVRMALKTLKSSRATFHFDYFKSLSDGRHEKLAAGEQSVVWVQRDANRKPIPHPFPPAVHHALREAYTHDRVRITSG